MKTYYTKLSKTEIIIVILIMAITVVALWFSVAYGGGRIIIKHYDKDYNRTGYTVIENDRESHFSKNWDRTGHSVPVNDGDKIDHYDLDWNHRGHSDIDREYRPDE